ncbi:MAG: Rieske 2Fe-2S domain-containing protein, partial [Anaerolineales bacterium]
MGALPPASGRYSVVDVSHLWQVACLSSELRRDRPLARTVQGLPIALFRAAGAGAPQALADRCPHRNAPLSLGRIRDGMLECRYHGWCFDGAGACRSVPGLYEGATAGTSATNGRPRDASALATAEQDGFVWVLAAPDPARPAPERPPRFPLVEEPGYA